MLFNFGVRVKRLSEAKDLVADLENQYAELTGKTVKGEKAKRIRLSSEQKAALAIRVGEIVKSAKDGISMGNIVKRAGAPDAAVRQAVKLSKDITKTGEKASTLYFAK